MAEGDYVTRWPCTAGSTLPTGITTDGTNIWVVDTVTTDSVDKYAMDGTYVSSFNLVNGDPEGITTDGSNIWVSDENAKKVYKYAMDGTYIGSWSLHANNTTPRGITTDGSNIFVLNSGFPAYLYKYTMAGAYVSRQSWPVQDTDGVTTDGTHVWVVRNATDRVYKYTMAGVVVSNWALNANNDYPKGITTNGAYIWVCDSRFDVDRVYQYIGGGVAATGSNIYYYDGTGNVELQRDDASPVQMHNGTEIIGLKLGATDDANASPMHVYDGTIVKAILKMP
jgi:hypothetical protein